MTDFMTKGPGKRSKKIIERDSKVISGSLTREYPFVLNKASGCYVWDVDGNKYLDFAAGISVANIGHNNFWVNLAVKKQLNSASHCAFSDFYSEVPVKFCEELLSHMPPNFEKVYLSNSGAEAVEAMYKLAKWHTKKKHVISFKNAFHGRTMGALSLSDSKKVHKQHFGPFLPVKHVPYPNTFLYKGSKEACSKDCLADLEKTIKSLKKDVAAIVLEPIQGEGGYIVPPISFIKGVRRLCNKYGILLCADEVQSGCYRTGPFLAIENFGVKADIVALSKAIGGGLPLGATVSSSEIMDWTPGTHASTFGGNLLSCTAGTMTLQILKSKKLGLNAVGIGTYMLNLLHEIMERNPIITDVRGIGLMIGVEIAGQENARKKVLCRAAESGLILLPAGKHAIRFCPPLTLTKKQADQGLAIFEESLKGILTVKKTE